MIDPETRAHNNNIYYGNPNPNPYQNQNEQNDIWQKAQIGNSEEEKFLNEYWDNEMRIGFIRKVYGILSFQLLITFSMVVLSCTSKSFSNFQVQNTAIFFLCLVVSLITSITLICFRSIARSTPLNYILLGVFTLCESYLVSFICGVTNPNIVLMAAAMTCGVVLALTYYAYTTKTDFTVLGGLFFVIGIVMLLFGLFLMFTNNRILHILYSCLGVIAFSLYLIYDTQLIVGNHENKLEIDDFIVGAIMLYLDIINLFLHILKLLKEFDKN